jgi:prepilin-type N-terminal cleavage/methylation domain-containing protein
MRERRGFTLMEVLVAIALLLVLSGVIFAFLRDVLASRERVTEVTARQRLASTIIDRIEHQAIFSLVGDSQFGSGLRGDETSLTILSRGVAVRETAHADSWRMAFADIIRTEYRFDEDSHRVRVRQEVPRITSGDDGNDRMITLSSIRAGSNDQADETFETRLYMLRFRYHDGVDWRSSYDSLRSGRLPTAIEVAIWFEPWSGSDWNEADPDPFTGHEDDAPQRLTFDMDGVFDEFEFATRADRDFRPEPPPDRIRVIAIPDADEDSFDEPPDEEGVL